MNSTFTTTLVIVACCQHGCGIAFGLDSNHEKRLRKNHKDFFCPNGHGQHFLGETEEDRLRNQVDNLVDRVDIVRDQRDREKRKCSAAKGQLTKQKNRAAAGVCPCCNRTFKQLASHMKTKHPEYAT